MRFIKFAILAAATWVAGHGPLGAAEFTYNEATNKEIAKKLGIPVYFAVPDSAHVPLPRTIDTSDRLIDFKHPDANGNSAGIGLRLVIAKRSGFAKRMAKSGLLQTGDILLTFRPEWGGAGTYPNLQMGVSHAGVAYVKDGAVYHLDNPMDAEHLGPKLKGDFTGGAGGVSGAVMSRSNKDQTVILWFEVADLDASMDAILAAGGSVAGDRNEIPGEGQVQYAADPEGNIIGLKQPRRQA